MTSSHCADQSWSIRELAEADLDAVADIEARVNSHPWSRRLFAEELSLPPSNRHWLVATESPSDGNDLPSPTIIGFGGVMYAPDAAHLMLIGVAPDAKRRGVGLRLCAALFLEARLRGAEGVTLEVRQSNRAAIALYEKLGMTSVGPRPHYYPDGEDAEIFWLHDLQNGEVVDTLTRLGRNPAEPTTPKPEGPPR